MLEEKGKYRINFLLDEPTTEQMKLQSEMYRKAAKLFANDLFDALVASGLLEEEAVLKALSTARAEEASGPGETLPGGCVGHVTTHGRPTRQGAHEFREIPEVPRDHLPTHPARGVFSGHPRQPVKWWIPPGQRARQQPLWAWQAHLSAHPR